MFPEIKCVDVWLLRFYSVDSQELLSRLRKSFTSHDLVRMRIGASPQPTRRFKPCYAQRAFVSGTPLLCRRRASTRPHSSPARGYSGCFCPCFLSFLGASSAALFADIWWLIGVSSTYARAMGNESDGLSERER